MPLTRSEVVGAAEEGLNEFEELLRSLDDQQWQTQTRCEGWAVADVAAHVVGNMTIIAEGRLADFADPGHVDREVAARKGKSPSDLADELRNSGKVSLDILGGIDDAAWSGPPLVDVGGPTLGAGVEAIFYDIYVHSQDINEAVGRTPDRDEAGIKVSVSHIADVLTEQGYKPATVALNGLPEFSVSGGGGERITGDPYDFILVATGRKDASSMGLDETINIYREQ